MSAVAACLIALLSASTERALNISANTRHVRNAQSGRDVTHTCRIGDSDCDGKITDDDLYAFQVALVDPERFADEFPACDRLCGTDANCDGRLDEQDIEPLLAEVLGS